jgi:hypothetical protein
MSHPLITIAELEARTRKTYADTALAQANAAIADASALVRLIADGADFHDDADALDLPEAIRPVVVAMVRRALEVPAGAAAGLTAEMVGAYSWQAAGGGSGSGVSSSGPAASLYATRREVRIIRKAAGLSSLRSVPIESPYTTAGSGDLFTEIEAE